MATTSVPSSEAGQTWTFVHPDDVLVSSAPGGPLAISLRYDQSDLLNNPHGMVAIVVREPTGNG